MKNKKTIIWLSILVALVSVSIVAIFAFSAANLLAGALAQRNIKDGGFLSGEPCGAPCFAGIIPGVTREKQAVDLLKARGLYNDNCAYAVAKDKNDTSGDHCFIDIGLSYFPDTDIVGEISFNPKQQITLEMAIAKYGQPNGVNVSGIWFTWEKQPTLSMSLYFRQVNTTINLGEQQGFTFNLLPSAQIITIEYYDPKFRAAWEAHNPEIYRLSPWHGYGDYVSDP